MIRLLMLLALLLGAPAWAQETEPPGPPVEEVVPVVPVPDIPPASAGPPAPSFAPGQTLTAAALNAALRAPTIVGGTIDGVPIGANQASTGRFTGLTANGVSTFTRAVTLGGNDPFQVGDGGASKRSIFTSYITPVAGVLSPHVLMQGNAAGTITSSASVAALRAFNINGDSLNAAGAQGGGLHGNYFGHTMSAGAVGGRAALTAFLYQGAATTANQGFYVGAGIFATSTASAGGTSEAKRGKLFGANIGATVTTGSGLHYSQAVGLEINVGTQSGTEVLDKVGLQIVQWNADAALASRTNAGLVFAAQGTLAQPIGWKHGITFGANHGTWPMHATGTLIGTSEANRTYHTYGYPMVTANGLDFATVPVKFTGRALASPGFSVDGTGQVAVGPATIGWSGNGLALGAAGKVGTLSSIVNGGGPIAGLATGYKVGDIVYDPETGGVWEVASLSGTAIASLAQIKAPTISSGSAPSNPRTLQGGRGGNATVNLTWADAGAISLTGLLIAPTTATPASASAACVAGTTAFDSNYLYRCVATNTWKRAALATW